MAVHEEDSDMKIVGEPPAGKEEIDTAGFLAELGREHFNGNYAKAKTLGANIVSAFSYRAAPEELRALVRESGVEPDEAILLQVRILSVFSAEYCLNAFLPSPMLSGVAVGELYEVLMQVSPEFYETLSHSTAFSFYYLALQAKDDPFRRIGEQFASLCGDGENEALRALGERLHRMNTAVYKKAINGFAFV